MTTTLSENSNKIVVHNNNSGQLVKEEVKVNIDDSVKQEDTKMILSTGITPDGIKYHVRRMKFEDIDEVLMVWKEIGLYEGTNTIQSFLTIDPEGFYVAVNENDGSIIGEVGAVFIEPSTAFIGLYAVRPEYQSKGVGIAVWRQMMTHVGDKNVGLLAIEDQYETYKNKAKLEIEDEVKIIEYKRIGLTSPETICNLIQSIDNVNLIRVMVNDGDDEIMNKIISYDQSVTGHDRSKLLPLIISEPDALCLAAIEVTTGSLLGYGNIHTTNMDRALFGPLFAQTPEIAELLFGQLIDQFPLAKTCGYHLMAPNTNQTFINQIASKLNCQQDHILPRLFRSFCPKLNWNQVYCITSPNYTVV